jgi:pyruvate kinase
MLRELGSQAMTIAKIEKPEALENLEDIVSASGGIMVARGDLGVEIDVAETPVAQKRIIDTCTKMRRPVIVATQMLDSMQHSRRPTRAEASDVANAILDGADACMLSGETAIGKYPQESVETMNRILLATERLLLERPIRHIEPDAKASGVHPITESMVYGAGRIAQRLSAKAVVISTRSGRTALAKSKQRDFISTLGVSANEETLRKMALFWGIEPIRGALSNETELSDFIDEWGKHHGMLVRGDLVVLMASGDFRSDAHNHVLVHEVK